MIAQSRGGRPAALVALAVGLAAQAEAQDRPEREPAGDPPRMVFDGAAVVDGTGAPARAGMAIVVEGGEIVAVAPSAELGDEERDGAEVVDATGWFAIPGLVESHTHLATRADRAQAEFLLNRQLYGGVTTARDMAGDVRSLMDLQRASLVGEIDAPDLHFAALMAGPEFFTDPRTVSSAAGETPGAVSWMQAVTGETDLAEAVTLARGTWATGIKTYAAIDGGLLAAIASEARRQGIPVWAHVHVGPARALEVARAGVRSMSHVCDIGSAAIPDDVFQQGQEGLRSGFVDVDLSDPAVDSVFAAMRRNGTVLDATLRIVVEVERRREARDSARAGRPGEAGDSVGAQGRRPGEAGDSAGAQGRRRGEAGDSAGAQGRRRGEAGDSAGAAAEARRPSPADRRRRGVRPQCGTAEAFALTRRAYEAGVMIAAGTDGMTPPDSAFPALHEEIRLLHEEAGMPMLEALKAASLHGAVALGLDDRIGTIEPGKLANIVFLREDPVAGAESLRSVELTVKRGTPYYRRDFVLGEPPRLGRDGG